MKIKLLFTCFAIVALLMVGSIPASASSSGQLIEQRIIIRYWEIVTINEGPDLIYIKSEPIIDSVEQLQAYKTARLDLLHEISETMNPEDLVGATVTFNYPIAYSEAVALATKYEFNLTYYEFIGTHGIQGGISELTGDSLEDREEQLKQVWPDFEIIGITMIQVSILVKQLLELQNELTVFLADIGPRELYEERSKGKSTGVTRQNLYYDLTKPLPPAAPYSLPSSTTHYTTFLLPPSTTPDTLLTTTYTTPVCTTDLLPPTPTTHPVPPISAKDEEKYHSPSVTLTSPNGGEILQGEVMVTWEATDLDNEPLLFALSYWNGSSWTLLGSEWETTTYLWDTTTIPDGRTYRIRVVASDGFLTGEDCSDAPFTIFNALQPEVEVGEFWSGGIQLILGLMVTYVGLILPRSRTQRQK